MNPNLDQSHYYRAAAFYHLGLLELAEREASAGLQINPVNRLEALRVRGTTALIAGRYSDSVAVLEEARRVSSAPVTDWYIAQAYYYEGERERAENILAELRGTAQAEQRAKATSASFLSARGEKQRAAKLLDEVLGVLIWTTMSTIALEWLMHSSAIMLKRACGWRARLPPGFHVIHGISATNCFSQCRATLNSNA